MQGASTGFLNLLNGAVNVPAQPRVIAEWNHNRYTPITYKDNSAKPEATYGLDLDMYPFDSITESPRPTRGVMKARTDQSLPIRNYTDSPPASRVYLADYDSKYKYWMSPDESNGSGALANCTPTVTYGQDAQTNKIYICFETGWTQPNVYQVQVTTNGTSWTTVAITPQIDSKGRVQLWHQADGSWGPTKYMDNPTPLRGVRLLVSNLTRASARLSMIEMGLRLERDLTSYLLNYSVNNTMSESDFITPLGTISSNTGSVTLSNIDGAFNHENTSSLYYGLLDANVQFTIDVGFNSGSGYEYIRQATMFSDEWSGDWEVEVGLKDASKFLQEKNPNQMLMENVTIGRAIWRLLDTVGFTDYAYTRSASDAPSLISYYWTDGQTTVWDTIQELCRTTQTSVYFDESGILQVKTRSAAFNKTQPVQWTFDGATNGTKLADIISLTPTTVYEANTVNIGYQKTNLLQDPYGQPQLETVWEPGGQVRDADGNISQADSETLVLRASALRSDMTANQMYFYLAANQTASWPYQGLVNIRGELIRYSGKQYAWYDTAGGRHYDWIYSTEDKLRIDKESSGPAYRGYNFFTGAFNIIERGYDYTEAVAHDVNINGWKANAFYGHVSGAQTQWNGGVQHIPHLSTMRLQTNGNFGSNMWYCAHRPMGQTMSYMGTRLRFPSNPKGPDQSAGIFFYGNDGNRANMYAVNVCSTAYIEANNLRLTRHEIVLMKRNNGVLTQLDAVGTDPVQNPKGVALAIVDDQWVDIDIYSDGTYIGVWINGKLAFSIPALPSPIPSSERMGLFVRGNGVADFEYFYGLKPGVRVAGLPDNQDFMDIVDSSYYSNQYYKDVLWDFRNVKKKRGKKTVTVKQQYATRLLDEFGITVHEAREYDVIFNKFPVLKSMPDYSNMKEVVMDEYVSSPFGAKFIIANAARTDAILNGEDAKLDREQNFDIIGRTVNQLEEQVYTVNNPQAVRARGEIVVDIDSRWIQSEGAAKDLGDWIISNWSDSNDECDLEVFSNPLIQIGDLVAVNYAPKNMTASTHKYFVIGVTNGWDTGPTTGLQLRRARV